MCPLAKFPALAGSQPLPLRIHRLVAGDQPLAAQPPAAPALSRLVRNPGVLPFPPPSRQRIVCPHGKPLPRPVSAPLARNVGFDLVAGEAGTCDRDCEVKVVQQARVRCSVVCVLAQVCHGVPVLGGMASGGGGLRNGGSVSSGTDGSGGDHSVVEAQRKQPRAWKLRNSFHMDVFPLVPGVAAEMGER